MDDPALRVQALFPILEREYPSSRPLLNYRNPYELMAAVLLSARTTDVAVNKVTPVLFERWPNPVSMAAAAGREVEGVIHSLGFFRVKARNLIASSALLIKRHGGRLPSGMDALTALPGIGRKSANVLRSHLWGLPAIIVDTHFGRVCRRLGLTASLDAAKVERELKILVPEDRQTHFSMAVNLHGRRYCVSGTPDCVNCSLGGHCPRVGLEPSS